jgi:hypothetical protein
MFQRLESGKPVDPATIRQSRERLPDGAAS